MLAARGGMGFIPCGKTDFLCVFNGAVFSASDPPDPMHFLKYRKKRNENQMRSSPKAASHVYVTNMMWHK